MADLLPLARKNPGNLTFASAGVGSFSHLAAGLFNCTSEADRLHVPCNGAGAATVEVVAGHANLSFGDLRAAEPHLRAGGLRTLGVESLQRNPILPDTTPLAEAGVPDQETVKAFGRLAPAGIPAATVAHRSVRSRRCRGARKSGSSSTVTAQRCCG